MLKESLISRRQLVSAAAVAALVAPLALAGCASSNTDDKKDAKEDAPAGEESAGEPEEEDGASYDLLEAGKLTVATSPDYPPFENMEDGEYVGLDMDLIRAVADKMGLEVEFKTIQFDGLIPAVAAGGQCDCAISAFTVDPERAKEVDFSQTYYTDDLAIVVMADSDLAVLSGDELDAAINAEDVVIAAQSGTTGESYGQENYANARTVGYGNATDCFAALQASQANAVITNNAVAKKTVGDSYTDAVIVKEIATGEDYAIAVSKDNPGLTAAINAAIEELVSEGAVEDLTNRHLG